MKFCSHIPLWPLSQYVDRFWACSDAPMHARERILPSGTVELVFNLVENEIRIYSPSEPDRYSRYTGAVFSGTYGRSFIIDPSQHAMILGVHFKPGGAYPFLGLPASALADNHADLDVIWGRYAWKLREQLCEAGSTPERFRILEAALNTRIHRSPERPGCIDVALEILDSMDSEVRVGRVAQSLQLSARHFIHLFSTHVGLKPKLFARIRRFQRLCDSVGPHATQDWAALAAAHGYFDQSHLIRDFRQFSGLSPTEYLAKRCDATLLNHVPLSR